MTQLVIMAVYLAALLGVGAAAGRLFRGTARDYFVASHSIGPLLLVLSIFGTTMTSFALVGSTAEAYTRGVGVFGMLASWSALVHTAVFFFVGARFWTIGRRYGYLTQIEYFRDRFESRAIGFLLFPVLVGLTIPYLLTGLLGAGSVVMALTQGALPGLFPASGGGVPPEITNFVVSLVVLTYVSTGGLRGAAWANAFQTVVFLVAATASLLLIARALGGPAAATEAVLARHPERLASGPGVSQLEFLTYGLIPLSVGAFPHVFQHWLTARSVGAFRMTVVLHPVFIMVLWLPCVLIGIWATAALMPDGSFVVPLDHAPNSQLGLMVGKLTSPVVGGLLGAGILAAIMSSLDSQFLAVSSIFTNDIVGFHARGREVSERRRVLLGRGFVLAVVGLTYGLSLGEPRSVFALGIWCFSGFAALMPLIVAALYWRRVTREGAFASIVTTGGLWLLLFASSGYGADAGYQFLGMMPVASLCAVSAAALVVTSLMTTPPSAATIDKFFGVAADLHGPAGSHGAQPSR